MHIEKLELNNFRNYAGESFDFHEGTNVFFGDNAQGKTNILEAVYVCATTRSPRGSSDSEMIRFGAEEAHLRMTYRKRNIPHRIDTHLRSGKKGVAIDGIPVKKAAEVFGQVNIVSFFTDDLRIIRNSPKDRRRFLDTQLCQTDRGYVACLAEYNKTVAQRNAFLKDPRYAGNAGDLLDIWDEQLVRYGAPLIRERERFLSEMNGVIRDIHSALSGGKESIELIYTPSAQETELAAKIRNSREKDLRWKSSSAGPHRDDFIILINGKDARAYGSQGQQRSAALSLKLSEIELSRAKTGEDPVLLLDDVLSELDSGRQRMLLGSIRKTQTFLTCTGMEDLESNGFPADRIFHIRGGQTV